MKATVLKIWRTESRGHREQWALKLDGGGIEYGKEFHWETKEYGPEPVGKTQYLLASAVRDGHGLYETYLFPLDENLKVLSLQELPGSRKNTVDILAVLTEAGYEVDLASIETAEIEEE